MSQLFTILDDKIVINKALLRYVEGPTSLTGSLEILGGASVQDNLIVKGRIVADVIEVNQIINKGLGGGSGDTTNFRAETEESLNGQGVTWNVGDTESTLVYRPGNRLYTNLHLDLERGRAYKIDNIEVLTGNTLGSSISRSSLRQLGPLNSLIVNGNVEIGQFVYVDSDTGRVGFGTESPNGSFSIVDNGAEFVIGSPTTGTVNIGTYTNHDVAITTDNIARVTVKTGGDVHVGNVTSRGAKFFVHGTIHAENIVTETKIERTDSVKFLATDGTVFGIGLQWVGSGSPKQLILRPDPDRLWSSEHIELATNRSLMINNNRVLDETTLGVTVTDSSLTSVGNLTSLTVNGPSVFNDTTAQKIQATEINFGEGSQLVKVNDRGVTSSLSFNLTVGEQNIIYADSGSITIGSSENTRRQIRTFGTLSVNVNNPDPELQFAVAGNIGFGGRKFITGASAPEQGNYNVGDICWSDVPQIGGHVGWICCVAGSPGMWFKFGMIG
jgi:hypothetical protein